MNDAEYIAAIAEFYKDGPSPEFRAHYERLMHISAAIAAAPARPTLTMKPLQWCDEREPNEDVRYNHMVAESPLGRISIEWKGWKEHDSHCVFVGGQYIDACSTLEDAQQAAERHLRGVAEALVASAQAAPVDATMQQDAERYRFLRDGEWRDTELEPFIRLQRNALWDSKIDAAIAAQQGDKT